MTEIKVPAPDKGGCKSISLDGCEYPVKDGYAKVSGYHADELKMAGDWLPSISCSLARTNLPEYYCPNCQRKYLYNEVCWCGYTRIPYDPSTCPLRYA